MSESSAFKQRYFETKKQLLRNERAAFYISEFGTTKDLKILFLSFKQRYFEDWKGKFEQIDDVCIIGYRYEVE